MEQDTAPACAERSIFCVKQIRINDQGMEQVYCCDGECTNVEVKRR